MLWMAFAIGRRNGRTNYGCRHCPARGPPRQSQREHRFLGVLPLPGSVAPPGACVSKTAILRGFPAFSSGLRRSEFPLGFQRLAPPVRDGACGCRDERQRNGRQVAGTQITSFPAWPAATPRAVRARARRKGARCGQSRSRQVRRDDRRTAPDLDRLVRSPVFTADEQRKALSAPSSTRPASRVSPPISCSVITDQPPPVRGARHDPRLPRAGRRAPRRSHRGSHRRRETQRQESRSAQGRAQNQSPAARTSISTSRSIRRSSAASSSRWAAAWSTPRCAPNSTRSSSR